MPVIDTLEPNLRNRAYVYNDMSQLFSFISNISCSKEEIENGVTVVSYEYPEDIDTQLIDEFIHFHSFVKTHQSSAEKQSMSHTDLYQIIFNENIHMAFPNVELVLRLFLSN